MTGTDALRLLATGYAAAADSLDGPAFAALFTPDSELWVPDVTTSREPTICRRGPDQLARVPSALARYRATHHRVGRCSYAVDGERASGTVGTVAHHLSADPGAADGDPGTDTVWYLTYEDEYRHTDDGWRIARRRLLVSDIEERAVAHVGPGRSPAGGPAPGGGVRS